VGNREFLVNDLPTITAEVPLLKVSPDRKHPTVVDVAAGTSIPWESSGELRWLRLVLQSTAVDLPQTAYIRIARLRRVT